MHIVIVRMAMMTERSAAASFYHLGPVEGAPLVAKHS